MWRITRFAPSGSPEAHDSPDSLFRTAAPTGVLTLEAKGLTSNRALWLAFYLLTIQSELSPFRYVVMPSDTKIDPFKPQQPVIPGVPPKVENTEAVRQRSSNHPDSKLSGAASTGSNSLWLGLGAVVAIAIAAIAWWAHTSAKKQSAEPQTAEEIRPATPLAKPAKQMPVAPGEIAHAAELAKTWSSKRFLFRDPMTSEETEALAVRLPGGDLWGISLRDSYGTCELEYVTNLETLRSQYNFRAEHPMVVNPCTQAVFDLALYGRGPHGLVRGEIVRGRAARPPIGIEIVERGNRVLAIRME